MTNETKTRETGRRIKIVCALPHRPRHIIEGYGKRAAADVDGPLHDLETALCQRFGGYASTPMVGGWQDAQGNVMHEPGTVYSVSFPAEGMHCDPYNPESTRDAGSMVYEAVVLFAEAGERLGEQWIHIEQSEFQAEHRATVHAASTSSHSNIEPLPADEPCECNGRGFEIMNGNEIQRCDLCKKYPDDETAAEAARAALHNVERLRGGLDRETLQRINDGSRSEPFARR